MSLWNDTRSHLSSLLLSYRNVTVQTTNNTWAWTLDKYQTNAHEAFFYVECVCNASFTVEILMRFVSCPNR